MSSMVGVLLLLLGLFLLTDSSEDLRGDAMLITSEESDACLSAGSSGPHLYHCSRNNPDMLWKWGVQARLYNVGSKQCLRIQASNGTGMPTLAECDRATSWRCDQGVLADASSNYTLAVVDGELVAGHTFIYRWKRVPSFKDLCERTFTAIYTRGGTAAGRPCYFPFKFNDVWHHECINAARDEEDDGTIPWCATKEDYDRGQKWGHCLLEHDGCGLFWEEKAQMCYQFNFGTHLTWEEARASCQSQGGDLLSIGEVAEFLYTSRKIRQNNALLWIGLNQLDSSAGWQWSDGTPLNVVNWGPDFYRNHSPKEALCGMYGQTAHTRSCADQAAYACKKFPSPSHSVSRDNLENWKYYPTVCEEGWISLNRHCYKLQRQQQTWLQASDACINSGGELMSITSLAHTELLVHLLHHENVSEAWIGMSSRRKQPVVFLWSDGSAVTLTSWQRHEPAVTPEDSDLCVSAQALDGKWKVTPCNTKLYFICKKPPINDSVNTEEPCEETWERHGMYCYGIYVFKQSYREAMNNSYCPLATITSRYEQGFISSLLSKRIIYGPYYFWIALEDRNGTGEFVWTSDHLGPHDLSFTMWEKGQPSHNKACAVVSRLTYGHWEVKDCENFTAMSLCKRPLNGAVIKEEWTAGTEAKKPDCSPSWYSEPHLDHCYKVFHEEKLLSKKTWQEAEDMCQALGAHLVSFAHLKEERFVITLLKDMFKGDDVRYFWTGFNNRNPHYDGAWEWSDGSPVISAFWINVYDRSMNCIALRAHTFVPVHCDTKLEWICKIPRAVTPKMSDSVEELMDSSLVFYQGYSYLFSNGSMNFQVYEFSCRWMGGDMTSIHSEAEQDFIHKSVKKISKKRRNWWIGLYYYEQSDGLLSWNDGSPVIYTNWEKTPESRNISMGQQQCVYIASDTGLWGYSNCSTNYPSICKTKMKFSIQNEDIPKTDGDLEHEDCPADWLHYGHKCFLVHIGEEEQKIAWHAADSYCKQHGGRLASISNEIEQAYILMHLFKQKNSFWIGRNRNDYDLWENGTLQSFTNWAPITANHSLASIQNRQCAAIAADHRTVPAGKWYLESCDEKDYGLICEKAPDISSHAVSNTFPIEEMVPYGDNIYRIISGDMTWNDAASACQDLWANLAAISDEYQQAFLTIVAHHLGYPLWIGLFRNNGEREFEWADGSLPLFTAFGDESEPLQEENCVYIDTTGRWRTWDCNAQLQGAVCLISTHTVPEHPIPHPIPDPVSHCPEDWVAFSGFCYSTVTLANVTDYQTAAEFCQQQGSRILTILSEEEDMFVQHFLATSSIEEQQGIWLDRITHNNDTETWSDGTPLQFSNWNMEVFYPVTEVWMRNQCVTRLMSDGTWLAARCKERRSFICKKHMELKHIDHYLKGLQTSHLVVPVVVLVSVILSALLIFAWYLRKKKRELSMLGLENLSCAQAGAEGEDPEECILITELEERADT